MDQALVAGIGDPVITISSEKSLPNAFGKADIFGRTTPTGMMVVQFAGVDGNKVRFIRRGYSIETGATTMNSTPLVIPNTQTSTMNGYVGNVPVSATSSTSGPPIVIPAQTPDAKVMPQAQVVFEIDLAKEREFVAGGKTIEIISATQGALKYRIH